MAPWSQIAKPFSFHFAANCFKLVLGAGFVGYGVAIAMLPMDVDEVGRGPGSDEKNTEDGKATSFIDGPKCKNNTDPSKALVRKYVKVAVTIGFGLFLSLPSLMSQVVWETMIPAITATDIAYDVGTESVMGIIPKWNAIIKKPTLPALGGLIGGKEGAEGRETTTSGVFSSDTRSEK